MDDSADFAHVVWALPVQDSVVADPEASPWASAGECFDVEVRFVVAECGECVDDAFAVWSGPEAA